jgi:hypothetical protein
MNVFGPMTVDATLTVGPGCEPLAAVKALVDLAEGARVAKWVEFPASILVFLTIPGDATSGMVYVFDRKSGIWYRIDFEDSQYGGYNQEQLEQLLVECNLLSLVERSALLESGLKWVVARDKIPVAI